jgi:hypothetical protein
LTSELRKQSRRCSITTLFCLPTWQSSLENVSGTDIDLLVRFAADADVFGLLI